ncbi:MAG: M14 family metallopeptidase [Bacillota bacterium]
MSLIASFDPGRYLRYAEMTALLQELASAYPALCQLEEIGRSAEGRAIWAVTLTNTGTGPAAEKPGYLVDANTHAGEVTGGAAALYTIHHLLTRYGEDPVATEILDTRAFYVVPRIAVDGVERYLSSPTLLRSSPKLYPLTEEPPGFYARDMDGDGRILQMRMRHPEGDWKADEQDPRLMVQRRPEEREGTFYRLFTEGEIKDWDGKAIPPLRRPYGLDFNRNYPAFWNPEGKQPGAGPYPLSEPETRALATFLLSHPNIGAYVAYHTTGGVLLRPPSNGADEKMNQADLESFKRIGELCTRVTGYPCKSTYEAFHYPGQEALVKGADDWSYEHLGVQGFTFELWDLEGRAGARGYAQIGVKGLLKLSQEELVEDGRKLLKYNDAALGGKGFIDWTPFEHPQLGPVEIGGWDPKFADQNPPEGPLLVEEVTRAAAFTLQHCLALPRLAFGKVEAKPVGGGIYELTVAVRNTGYLPTNVTEMAVQQKRSTGVKLALEGAELVAQRGAEVRNGRLELGEIPGWGKSSERWVTLAIRGRAGAIVTLTARHDRAGLVRATVELR